MAGTRIETEFASLGADGVVRAFEAVDAALVKSTEAARKQTAQQSKQATVLRQLRDAEREEQNQLKQAAGIIDRTTTAEERYDKELTERRNHLAAGRLTQDQYNRSVAESRERLLGAEKAGGKLTAGLGKMAAGLATVAIAARAIRAVGDVNRELEQSVGEVTERVGTAATRLAIQAGLSDGETNQQLGAIGSTLKNTPATGLEGAIAFQQQAVSVGFSGDDIDSGRALDVFLKLNAATGAVGPNADTTTSLQSLKAAASVLKSSGQELTADNLESLAIKFSGLFAVGAVEAGDLPALGEVTAPLKSFGIGEDERLGAFTTAAELLGGKKGATALKQAAGFLAASSKMSGKLQKKYGLDTTGFDVNGEGLADSIENLQAQMAPLSEEQRRLAVFEIFGKEAGSNFLTLAANVGSIRKFTGLAGQGRGEFDKRVEIFRGSELAEKQQLAVAREMSVLASDSARGGTSYREVRERLAAAAAAGLAATSRQGLFARNVAAGNMAMQRMAVGAGEFIGVNPATVAEFVGVDDTRTAAYLRKPVSAGDSLVSGVQGVAEMVNLLGQLLQTQQATHDVIAGGQGGEPAAARPFVPESVSNSEPSRVSALSAEASR